MQEYIIDAANQPLGRLASRVAVVLRGKHLPDYEPRIEAKIKVKITNIDQIKFTGNKFKNTVHYRYSGYPGGLYERTIEQLWQKAPKEVIRKTVYRMLPVNRMRDKLIKNLIFG